MLTQVLEKRNIPPLLQREDMLAILQKEVYGQMPPKPERVTWEIQEEKI